MLLFFSIRGHYLVPFFFAIEREVLSDASLSIWERSGGRMSESVLRIGGQNYKMSYKIKILVSPRNFTLNFRLIQHNISANDS